MDKLKYVGCVFDGHRDGKGHGNVYDFYIPDEWEDELPVPGDRVLVETAGGDQIVTVVTNPFEDVYKEGYRPVKSFVWLDGDKVHDAEVARVALSRGLI